MASNPLTHPSGPSPWGQAGRDVVPAGTPRLDNALVIPRTPAVPPVPAAPVSGQMQPGVQELPPGTIPQVAPEDRISPRVPVPKGDFPEHEHKDLHERMGEHFDNPGAQKFVHDLYNLGRKLHPDIAPRHLLETTRDSYHAWRHGFMPAEYVGKNLAKMARARQREAERPVRAVGVML